MDDGDGRFLSTDRAEGVRVGYRPLVITIGRYLRLPVEKMNN